MIDTISWITVYPEIVLMVMACAILLIDLGEIPSAEQKVATEK